MRFFTILFSLLALAAAANALALPGRGTSDHHDNDNNNNNEDGEASSIIQLEARDHKSNKGGKHGKHKGWCHRRFRGFMCNKVKRAAADAFNDAITPSSELPPAGEGAFAGLERDEEESVADSASRGKGQTLELARRNADAESS